MSHTNYFGEETKMAVTAALVKELRERTAAGMLDCKKALVETDGDIELAIENMRKSGQAKAAKKAGRIAAEGVILTKVAKGVATMMEVNSETDFVARDDGFVKFGQKLIEVAFANKINDMDTLNSTEVDGVKISDLRDTLVAKIGENISPRRVVTVEGDNLGAYVHSARIGVIAILQGGDEELAKDIAMHVAASSPQFVKPEDVPAEVVAKEKEIQLDIALQSGKPPEIAEKMVSGRMKKFTGEISLTGQPFV
jgi:elongation factor Ts